jgi:putative ABC transport system permease protein
MLRHILKLVWKRKTRNALLSLEILLAFVLVFAVVAMGVRYAQLYRLPLGFDYDDVWYVQVRTGSGTDAAKPEHGLAMAALARDVRALPQVEDAGLAHFSPFTNSRWRTNYALADGSSSQSVSLYGVNAESLRVLGVQPVEGRLFSEADGADERLIVINRQLAQAWFPGRSAVGQLVSDSEPDKTKVISRIVGVVDELRPQGDFTAPVNTIVTRFVAGHSTENPSTLLLRVRPGTPRSFEAPLSARLHQLQPGWSFEILPLAEQRTSNLRESLVPLAVMGVISVFLMLMVGFGLFGVLWQNTTLRIPEIGLRRAIGASPRQIYGQIVAEQLVLSTFAVLAGLILLVQLPLTGVLGESLNWPVFGLAALLSAGLI